MGSSLIYGTTGYRIDNRDVPAITPAGTHLNASKGKAGRPLGSGGTPAQARMMARLEKDFPDFHPVLTMVEGAMALRHMAQHDPSMWPECINACDRVAKYLVPQLKATEVTVKEPTKIVIIDAAAEDILS